MDLKLSRSRPKPNAMATLPHSNGEHWITTACPILAAAWHMLGHCYSSFLLRYSMIIYSVVVRLGSALASSYVPREQAITRNRMLMAAAAAQLPLCMSTGKHAAIYLQPLLVSMSAHWAIVAEPVLIRLMIRMLIMARLVTVNLAWMRYCSWCILRHYCCPSW